MKIMNLMPSLPVVGLALVPAAQVGAKVRKTVDVHPTQPNVVMIVADDLGYGDLECYGATRVQTPNVNRLAGQGVRFTNAHAIASTSTPSRYGLLTGQYSWRRNDTDIARGNAKMIIRPEQFTLADAFQSAGYNTAAIGKWHLGLGNDDAAQDWNAQLPCSLGDIGFNYHYIMAATADRVPCVFIEQGHVANYDPSAPIEVSYARNFPGEPTGRSNPELLYNLKPSHAHDNSIVNGISRIGFMKGGGKALWKDENIADSITERAVRFMRESKEKPFFLYFCTNDVHVPRFPHDRFRGKNPMGYRGDAIAQFDWSVGRIMETLEELGLSENTIVILTSDNGPVVDDGYQDRAVELLGDHKPAGPLRSGKYSVFEGGTTVPMIVSWPRRVKGNQESDALVSHIDYFRSLSNLVGARIPQKAAPDSRDCLTTLLGEDRKDRDYVIEQAVNRTLSIRNREWKYVEPSDGYPVIWETGLESGYLPTAQLFDMSVVGEKENLASKYPEKVFHLQNLLRRERAR